MVSSKNVKVSQKRCLRTFIESLTGSCVSEQIILFHFSSIMFVERISSFSMTAISLTYDICSAFPN